MKRTPATPTANGPFADLGSCGTRSLNHADAHDPTPATPAEATCYYYDGAWYHATGKEGTRFDDGQHTREFATREDARLWLTDDGQTTED